MTPKRYVGRYTKGGGGSLYQAANWGWNPRWDSVVSGSLGSQEDWGCLSAAEFLDIRTGKLATTCDARRGL